MEINTEHMRESGVVIQRSRFDKNNKLIILPEDEQIIRGLDKMVKVKKDRPIKLGILDVLTPLKTYDILVGKDKHGLYTLKYHGKVLTYVSDTKLGCSVYSKVDGNWKARPFLKKADLNAKMEEIVSEIKKQQEGNLKPINDVIAELEK